MTQFFCGMGVKYSEKYLQSFLIQNYVLMMEQRGAISNFIEADLRLFKEMASNFFYSQNQCKDFLFHYPVAKTFISYKREGIVFLRI